MTNSYQNEKPAKHGELGSVGASWGEIDADGRLHIPTVARAQLTWYEADKSGDVVVELREVGSLRLHDGKRFHEIENQRQALYEELADSKEALRRIALSAAVFFEAKIGKSNRRITLTSDILAHLGVKKSSRVLCLLYADCLEIVSETRAAELTEAMRTDISLDS